MPYLPIFVVAAIHAGAMPAWDVPWPGQQMFRFTVVVNIAGFPWLSSRLSGT